MYAYSQSKAKYIWKWKWKQEHHQCKESEYFDIQETNQYGNVILNQQMKQTIMWLSSSKGQNSKVKMSMHWGFGLWNEPKHVQKMIHQKNGWI